MLRPVERRRLILNDIGEGDDNLIPQLSEKYAVSEMTIRRDLKFLEEEGFIKRTWGGAILWPPARREPLVLNRERRQQLHKRRKEAIAAFAAKNCVEDGSILIMEGGTTVTAMARYLAVYKELTVVTNGLYTAAELQNACMATLRSFARAASCGLSRRLLSDRSPSNFSVPSTASACFSRQPA